MLAQAVHQNIDCQDWFERGYTKNGIFFIYHDRQKLKVRCRMSTDATKGPVGGFIVFQKQRYGTISFDREWQDYKNGFGDTDLYDYWLGLDLIHKLTYGRNVTLNNYRLHSGVPDSTFRNYGSDWISHDGAEFTTKDVDQDGLSDSNSAQTYEGG